MPIRDKNSKIKERFFLLNFISFVSKSEDANYSLAKALRDKSGINVYSCYQCGKCTAGCPVAYTMDYKPNQVIRLIQLGRTEEAIKSDTIWLCASCNTCSARCPRNIKIAEVMDELRCEAYKRNIYPAKYPNIQFANHLFLKSIESFGRIFEAGLILFYNLLTGNFLKDFKHVPGMLLKGKINPFPHFHDPKKELKTIFQTAKSQGRIKNKKLVDFRLMIKGFIASISKPERNR